MSLKDEAREYAIKVLGLNCIRFVATHDFKDYVESWAKTIILLGIEAWDDAFDMVLFRTKDNEVDIYYVYEVILAEKALKLCLHLRDLGFKAKHEPYRLPLKQVAVKAGAGCYGKNSLIISPQYGSRIRFTCIVTDAELEPDQPFKADLCGECDLCVRACPLNAIREPYRIDARRCVNSLTPPSREVDSDVMELAPKLLRRPTENAIILCSICQAVCPYNKGVKNF
ncbi:MAG: 4Fe-4S double cluster binding domain-containing protein [Candidatus Nezhaarchaeales archaeon]